VVIDYKRMVEDYLQEVGIGPDGKPTAEVLRSLGMEA
jgi:aldehyde:ferredoxin oxidoreductase